MFKDIFRLDREKLMVKQGLAVLVALVIVTIFEAIFGKTIVYAMVAALFVSFVSQTGNLRQRMLSMGILTLIGAGIAFLALFVGDVAWEAALLFALVTYFGGLAAAYGKAPGEAGYFFVIWAFLTMLIASRSPGEPSLNGAAFLFGGLVAMVVAAIRFHFGWVDATKTTTPNTTSRPPMAEAVRSPVGISALVRAFMIAVAIFLGYSFWTVEPFWVAITIVVVMQPSESLGVKAGIQRGIGTVAGGALALTLINNFPSFVNSNAFIIYLLVTSALCVMFYKANYMIYAFFMTQAVVGYYGLAVGNVSEVDEQRLLGVLIGVALSFVGLGIQHLLFMAQKQKTKTA